MSQDRDPVSVAIEILEGSRRDELEVPETHDHIFKELVPGFVTYAQELEGTIERQITGLWDYDQAEDLDDFVTSDLFVPIADQSVGEDDLEWLYALSLNRRDQTARVHEVVDKFLRQSGIDPKEESRVSRG